MLRLTVAITAPAAMPVPTPFIKLMVFRATLIPPALNFNYSIAFKTKNIDQKYLYWVVNFINMYKLLFFQVLPIETICRYRYNGTKGEKT